MNHNCANYRITFDVRDLNPIQAGRGAQCAPTGFFPAVPKRFLADR